MMGCQLVAFKIISVWCLVREASGTFRFQSFTRTRPREKNAAHTCTRLHTFLFLVDNQVIINSTQTLLAAHVLHKSAHTLHTSPRFAHKRLVLHTGF